jgi:hypothetical protein
MLNLLNFRGGCRLFCVSTRFILTRESVFRFSHEPTHRRWTIAYDIVSFLTVAVHQGALTKRVNLWEGYSIFSMTLRTITRSHCKAMATGLRPLSTIVRIRWRNCSTR